MLHFTTMWDQNFFPFHHLFSVTHMNDYCILHSYTMTTEKKEFLVSLMIFSCTCIETYSAGTMYN